MRLGSSPPKEAANGGTWMLMQSSAICLPYRATLMIFQRLRKKRNSLSELAIVADRQKRDIENTISKKKNLSCVQNRP
tara:strand:- start:72 stop:305 length:234 start_codon:yes stop_codon:yes gene_type:complete